MKALKNKYDFEKVKKEGTFKSDKYLLYYILNGETEEINPVLKIGFSISKKIGGAVVRNKIRRILREIVRITCINCRRNIDIYIIAKKNIVNAEFKEVSEQFKNSINSFLTSH